MIQKTLRFLSNSSIFIALMPSMIVYVSSALLGIDTRPEIYLSVFLIFFSCYSFNKLFEVKDDSIGHKSRVGFVVKNRVYLYAFSIVCYAMGVYLIGKDRPDLIPFSFIPLAFVVFYSLKLPINSRFRRIKDVVFMKNISVAFVWVCFSVLLPSFFATGVSTIALLIVGIMIFFRLFINTVVFDVTDHEQDKRAKVMTIPVVFGYRNTNIMLIVTNLSLGVLLFLATYWGWLGPVGYLLNINTAYTFLYMYLLHTRPEHKRLITDVGVDGEYLVKALSVFAGLHMI